MRALLLRLQQWSKDPNESLAAFRSPPLTPMHVSSPSLTSRDDYLQCSRSYLRAAAACSQSLIGQVPMHKRRVVQVHLLTRIRKRRKLSIRPTCQHAVAVCPARHDNASRLLYNHARPKVPRSLVARSTASNCAKRHQFDFDFGTHHYQRISVPSR